MRDIEITKNMDLGYMSPLEQHNEDVMEENVDEKAVSKSQQRFFGMVDAYKKGELDNPSKSVKDAADGMSMKQVKDFAKTKHKGLPNHVDESTIRSLVRNTLKRLQENVNLPSNEMSNENIYTMEDWRRDGTLKVQEGQLIAPDVYFQLLESVPPASTGRIFQPGEAYSYDWKHGVQLYQTFKNEGNNYYRYIGLQPVAKYGLPNVNKPPYRAFNGNISEEELKNVIRETVQTHLVNVLGKYTQGKTSSKEANKAIMDLANSSNKKKLNEELDASTLEYFNKIRNGECETLEWEGRVFRVPPQLKQIAQQTSEEFGVRVSTYIGQDERKIYYGLLVDTPEDCDFYTLSKNLKLFLLEYDIHYTGWYNRTIFFNQEILKKP